MAQKPMMRANFYTRALRASQNVMRAEVWAATLRGGEVEELVLNPFVVVRMVHEVSRTKELAERRRAHSVDHPNPRSKNTARGTYLSPEASW
jgi:hypothetical protein